MRYYGCPAEEGGSGKAFMVREGVFDDVDVAISWHPAPFMALYVANSLSMIQLDFTFAGKASHAAASPHLGRSALDAVELMNVGVNYMREHVPSDARIHYAITDSGGLFPNVVQARAAVRYMVRAIELPVMFDILERVKQVADGAALMTQTTVKSQVVSAMSSLLGNAPLEQTMQANLQHLGPPPFDEADREFARKMQGTFTADDIATAYKRFGVNPRDGALCNEVVPADSPRAQLRGSTDVGDVSWVVPTVQAYGRDLRDRHARAFLAADGAGQDCLRAQRHGPCGQGDGRDRARRVARRRAAVGRQGRFRRPHQVVCLSLAAAERNQAAGGRMKTHRITTKPFKYEMP